MKFPEPTIPGVKDLWSLLEVLRDPERYTAQLKRLDDTLREMKTLAGQVVATEEIDTTRLQARAALQSATEQLAKAKATAAAMVQDAAAESDAIRAALARAGTALETERDAWQTRRAADQVALGQREHAVSQREAEASAAMEQARTLDAAAQALRSEYHGRLTKLEAGIAAARG